MSNFANSTLVMDASVEIKTLEGFTTDKYSSDPKMGGGTGNGGLGSFKENGLTFNDADSTRLPLGTMLSPDLHYLAGTYGQGW